MSTNDRIQLKQEEVVGNEVVLNDINPKTNTTSIDDPSSGTNLATTIDRMWNAINNKLSRNVNSVNGRTGVVVLDASDVGLGNVDNVSFDEIKDWVITRIMRENGFKRIALFDSLDEVDQAIVDWNNDEVYANKPFYSRHGYTSNNDNRGYIGYIYYEDDRLKHREKVIDTIGSADNSIIYSENEYADTGRIGVNIWEDEDALEIYNDPSGEKSRSGLRIDKNKLVPNTYFFDGIYGTIITDSTSHSDTDSLVYWSSDPADTTMLSYPLIQIQINGEAISMRSTSSGSDVSELHTPQTLKFGDIILTNFAYDDYINTSDTRDHTLYDGMIDALTCRQPAVGRVIQVGNTETNTPYIVDFCVSKPNVGHGLKLYTSNTNNAGPADTMIGLDLISKPAYTVDGVPLYNSSTSSNVSGLNYLDIDDLTNRTGQTKTNRSMYTVFPTGKSANLLASDNNELKEEYAYILPNFSMCVIPGYELTQHDTNRPIVNWNSSSPMGTDETLGRFKWNMIGLNLEKKMFASAGADPDNHRYARNISGLRVNYDSDVLDDSWFGFNNQGTIMGVTHSGGLSINVGDFLGIGTSEELAGETPSSKSSYYDEGKLNVRIDPSKGLYNLGNNRLAINVATGKIYQTDPVSVHWLSGGLGFVDGGVTEPGQGLLQVNTGRNSAGLCVKNDVIVNDRYENGVHYADRESNVLCVQPYSFAVLNKDKSPVQIHSSIIEEDIAHLIPIRNAFTQIWDTQGALYIEFNRNKAAFSTDYIYIGGGKRFIVKEDADPDNNTLVDYFVFYTDYYEYEAVINKLNDPTNPSADFPLISRQCHVYITPSSGHAGSFDVKASIYEECDDDLRVPDLNHNGLVGPEDATTISRINMGIVFGEPVYSNMTHTLFYTDEEMTQLLEPRAGQTYRDMNDIGPAGAEHQFEMLYVGITDEMTGTVSLEKLKTEDHILDHTDYLNADVNRDGLIDGVDQSLILNFDAMNVAGDLPSGSLEDKWRYFLRTVVHINVPETPTIGFAVEIFNYKYDKGVRVRYNELKGLTTNPEYSGENIRKYTGNDIANSLSIKIYDKSAGMEVFNPVLNGGLRFGTNGYLGVRINNNNRFNAALPNQNTKFDSDDMSIGTKGLHIYNDNVLGVQLTPEGDLDNGQLKIDVDGCLKLSDAFHPNKESLTFSGQYSDGTSHTVAYNGEEAVTINLGPGLCFGPPPV